MLQSIEVLQLPGAELEAFLMEQAQENEALRLERAPEKPLPSLGGAGAGGGRAAGGEASDRKSAWLENQEAPGGGLIQTLEEQLSWLDVTGEEGPWVRLVI